ncbi:lipopolysaccharide biosynthesis protein [Cupriavidus sp. D384]|uniref:lipopolysaccharide biosynthesis protein n=1 Tax=Cupriavidus sp. D384 TaxID=1538095 RepID=UPI000832B8DE|nr:oligosaccharide flippase family protein [Cupriavidus sp. D384]
MRRVVASNLLWMLADRGLQVGVGIAVVGMLARALGTEGFGHFQYAQSLVFIAAAIPLVCSAEVVVPRLVALQTTEDKHSLLMHAFAIRFAAGVFGYTLIGAYLLLTQQPADTWIPAMILGMAIMLREPFGVVIAWMQSRTHNRPNVIFNLVALAAKAALVGSLFFTGVHAIAPYASAFALEAAIAALLLTWYYFARAPREIPPYIPTLTRDLIRDGTLFWISFMVMVAARRADQLILKPLVHVAELGAYSATMQILDNYTTIAGILAAGIAPLYVYAQTDRLIARRNILVVAGAMLVIGFCGAAVLALSADWIVRLLYGPAFAATAGLLRLGAVASSLTFADAGLSLLAIYLRKPRWIALKWALVLSTTVLVDVIAIPRLGTMGAVLGYATANAVAVAFGVTLWLKVGKASMSGTEQGAAAP